LGAHQILMNHPSSQLLVYGPDNTQVINIPCDECFESLVNDQLGAQLFYFIIRLLQSSTCFEQRHAHHQEVKLY